jgi:hypothetical protein
VRQFLAKIQSNPVDYRPQRLVLIEIVIVLRGRRQFQFGLFGVKRGKTGWSAESLGAMKNIYSILGAVTQCQTQLI